MRQMRFPARLATFADKPDDCWEWPGCVGDKGYGKCVVRVHGERFVAPHRAAYTLLVGPIPDGAELDHLCRNRRCMNPRHLEPVDHRVNVLRGAAPSARHARLTRCKRGHPLAAKQGKYGKPPYNHRYCPTCASQTHPGAVKAHRARRRAAKAAA